MHVRWLIVVAVLGAGGFVHAKASAAAPATQNSVQLGLGFRYGIETMEGDINPWGVGLGVDGGHTLPNAVYLGIDFDYFFGDSRELPGLTRAANEWQLMAEGGYDIGLGPSLILRPKLGAGQATLLAEWCQAGFACTRHSSTHFALAPGVKLVLVLPSFGLSLDLRYAIIYGRDAIADFFPQDSVSSKLAKVVIVSAGVGF